MARTSKRVKVYAELRGALRDALSYEQGTNPNLRITKLPRAPQTEQPSKRRGSRHSRTAGVPPALSSGSAR